MSVSLGGLLFSEGKGRINLGEWRSGGGGGWKEWMEGNCVWNIIYVRSIKFSIFLLAFRYLSYKK